MASKRISRRRGRANCTRRRGGNRQDYKYYVAANIVDASAFAKVRTLLADEFTEYKKESFRYDDIHITMAYGPIIQSNSEPEISSVLPGIEALAPTKHIKDVTVKGVSLFLRKDRIIVKAEIHSAVLTKLKQQLEERYESIGNIATTMRAEIMKEESELAARYPELLYRPYDPDKWAHITLLALKADTPISVTGSILKRAGVLMKEAPAKLECDYLYIVSKKSNKTLRLIDI